MKEYYLDSNAHVPMGQRALNVFVDYNRSKAGWGHALAPSLPGQLSATKLEEGRGRIAKALGAESASNIIFTSGATQACEWGLSLLDKKYGNVIYQSGIEHSAIYQKLDNIDFIIKSMDASKIQVGESLKIESKESIAHIVCTHVQNETGIYQNNDKLKYFKERSNGLLFSDMCQSIGKAFVNLKSMPVDIAVFGAHKWGGPASVGIIYVKDFSIYKEFGTGSRYFSDRPGTPDVGSILAAAEALEESLELMPTRLIRMKRFQECLEDKLKESGFIVIGEKVERVFNTTFVQVPKFDCGLGLMIVSDLSRKGIYLGMGSACGSLHSGPSLTMKSLGIMAEAHDCLRISQHGDYDTDDALYVSKEIIRAYNTYK
jgi:cysteine desulfurase